MKLIISLMFLIFTVSCNKNLIPNIPNNKKSKPSISIKTKLQYQANSLNDYNSALIDALYNNDNINIHFHNYFQYISNFDLINNLDSTAYTDFKLIELNSVQDVVENNIEQSFILDELNLWLLYKPSSNGFIVDNWDSPNGSIAISNSNDLKEFNLNFPLSFLQYNQNKSMYFTLQSPPSLKSSFDKKAYPASNLRLQLHYNKNLNWYALIGTWKIPKQSYDSILETQKEVSKIYKYLNSNKFKPAEIEPETLVDLFDDFSDAFNDMP